MVQCGRDHSAAAAAAAVAQQNVERVCVPFRDPRSKVAENSWVIERLEEFVAGRWFGKD